MARAKNNKSPEIAKAAMETKKEMIATSRAVGRPSMRTEEMEVEIITRLADGEGLLSITSDSHMPSRSTISEWMAKDPEFLKKVMSSYQMNTLFMAEFAMNVLDGGEHSTGNVERDKAKANFVKWLMGKYNRPLFGEHIDIKQTTETVQIVLPSEFDGIDADFAVVKPETPNQKESD